MRAWLALRSPPPERVALFRAGLAAMGYEVSIGLPTRPDGLLVTWNRIYQGDAVARAYEQAGLPVIVAENASWGDLVPGKWLHVTRTRHNTAGTFPVGGADRWDALGVDLQPWCGEGETVVIAQRGIGSPPTRMPLGWPQKVLGGRKGRIRLHPGRHPAKPSLRADLGRCGRVVTWGSGAAIQALAWGIPVESHMPHWIGEQDNTDAGRLAMFRRLAWAQWRLSEIESGEAFAWLLKSSA